MLLVCFEPGWDLQIGKIVLVRQEEIDNVHDDHHLGKGSLSLEEIGEFFLSQKKDKYSGDLEGDVAGQSQLDWEGECAFCSP